MTRRDRTTALRHLDQALPINHNGTAPPRPGSPHQSPRHNTTQTRLSPAITTAQRHPDQAPPSNHNGTAPPRPGSPQQSQRHSATQTRLSPAITTAQRHPDQAPPSNHNGTAPPRPGSPQQSQRHSATQTRLSPPITTAQRHKASPRRPSRPILRAQRIGHKTNARGRARTWAISFPKSERTRSRPQTPQTKTRTLRYAFGKKTISNYNS